MLTFKNTKPIEVYNSLDKLKILVFWDIIKTKNIALLDVNYSESKEYSKKQLEQINTTWSALYDEYYVLKNDSKSKMKMDKSFSELILRDKINQIKNNYDFLISLTGYIRVLSPEEIAEYEQDCYANLIRIDKKLKPQFFKGIHHNIKYLEKILNSLINKYNVEHKKNDKEVTNEIANVYDVVANAESWLDRNLDIDNMVVSRWISYEKQIKDKQKAQKKNGK